MKPLSSKHKLNLLLSKGGKETPDDASRLLNKSTGWKSHSENQQEPTYLYNHFSA